VINRKDISLPQTVAFILPPSKNNRPYETDRPKPQKPSTETAHQSPPVPPRVDRIVHSAHCRLAVRTSIPAPRQAEVIIPGESIVTVSIQQARGPLSHHGNHHSPAGRPAIFSVAGAATAPAIIGAWEGVVASYAVGRLNLECDSDVASDTFNRYWALNPIHVNCISLTPRENTGARFGDRSAGEVISGPGTGTANFVRSRSSLRNWFRRYS